MMTASSVTIYSVSHSKSYVTGSPDLWSSMLSALQVFGPDRAGQVWDIGRMSGARGGAVEYVANPRDLVVGSSCNQWPRGQDWTRRSGLYDCKLTCLYTNDSTFHIDLVLHKQSNPPTPTPTQVSVQYPRRNQVRILVQIIWFGIETYHDLIVIISDWIV